MGIGGAALATLIAKIPCAVIALIVLTRPEQLIRIDFRGFQFDKSKMGSIVKNRTSNSNRRKHYAAWFPSYD